jgi:hypothetical protein
LRPAHELGHLLSSHKIFTVAIADQDFNNSKLKPRFHSTMASEIPTKEELTVLDRQDDPFAPREGKTLIWKDVNMTLVCDMQMQRLRSASCYTFLIV